jgi:acyl carrier protein
VGVGRIDQAAVEQCILSLLAAKEGCEPADLRERLAAAGKDLPYDSVLLVEQLVAVESRFGVRLDASLVTARHMCSVGSFAELVCQQAEAHTDGAVEDSAAEDTDRGSSDGRSGDDVVREK